MMPNTFEYKGYIGRLTVDADDNLIHGLVINIERDTITFRGETPAETQQDFQQTIDEYLADCITDGIEADVPKVLATN
jgi:predicted HicB family RNase H-like nuclease